MDLSRIAYRKCNRKRIKKHKETKVCILTEIQVFGTLSKLISFAVCVEVDWAALHMPLNVSDQL
jgi:hypothetical protein